MERVSIVRGDLPVLIIAPHGPSDDYTDLIAERIAEKYSFYAVINRGWERSPTVDYKLSKANCNDVYHCHEDVVNEEFLQPILRFKKKIMKEYGEVYIFIIHGVGNHVKTVVSDPGLELIVGYGEGNFFQSCSPRLKNAFFYKLQEGGLAGYEASGKSPYAGGNRKNLNQLFRHWYFDEGVHSLQLEIVKDLRKDELISEVLADILGKCIDKFLLVDNSTYYNISPKIYY